MKITRTPAFCSAYPDGIFGVLIARGCANRPQTPAIAAVKWGVEGRLRERFPGETIDTDPVARAYAQYFRRYGGRYPVVHQAKTVLAGRTIESTSALVEAMFTTELDSLVLTSGARSWCPAPPSRGRRVCCGRRVHHAFWKRPGAENRRHDRARRGRHHCLRRLRS